LIGKLLAYRKLTLTFFVMAVAIGAVSFLSLPKRENPDITISVATVKTVYPGASPEKVEQLVTKPLEEKINEMENIAVLSSVSSANVSLIVVEMQAGVDNERAWDTLRQKVQAAEDELPEGAQQPVINDNLTQIAEQIVHLVVERPEQKETLHDTVEYWKSVLRSVPGVSSVETIGLPEQEVRITLDTKKLEAYGLPWGVVAQALQNARDRTPIGTIRDGGRNVYLQLGGEWKRTEDIAETVVFSHPSLGTPVKLKDVADVRLTVKKPEQTVYYNGKPAVDIVINGEPGVDVPSLQRRIDHKLEELVRKLPEDVQLVPMFNQRDSVDRLFSELSKELLIGMAAVILVCSLGLSLRNALLVALAIPVSVAVGFIPIPALGIDLNQITIVSLVIVLGILVDDAIVVNDNIERRLQLGDDPITAALEGSRDVAVSIVTATLATAAAFFPLFFLKGDIGDFIRPIPVVISVTLLASMAMSLTIVPIVRQWTEERAWFKKNGPAQENGQSRISGLLGKHIARLSDYYERQIHLFLKRPLLTGLTALVIGTASFGLLPLLGVEYFPKAEREEMLIDIELPMGSPFEATDDTVRAIGAWIQRQYGVKSVSAYAGTTSPKFYYTETPTTGERIGQLFVRVDTKLVSTGELVKPWREKLQQMYPDLEIIPRELEQGPPVGAPIAVRISGPDLDELRQISGQLQEMLAAIPGAVNISDDMGTDLYSVNLELDKEKAGNYGVTDKDLSSTLRLVTEGIQVSKLDLGEKLIDVTLYAAPPSAMLAEATEHLTVPSQTGALYPLQEFVTFTPDRMISSIHHRNLNRTVTVRSYAEERLPEEIVKQLQEQLRDYALPPGYTIEFGGENEERNEAFAAIGKLSVVVVFLIYLIIAMQFYSLTVPLLVLSTVYLAAAGAFIGLFVTGAPIGFMALMGAVSLSGIVVRNGIVLVEFIVQARERGLGLREAIAQAGRARLRPILLTTATAACGLAPMAVMGGSLWRPMAVTIIFGLIYSTVLTLIVVPSLYLKLTEWRERRKSASTGAFREHSRHIPGAGTPSSG